MVFVVLSGKNSFQLANLAARIVSCRHPEPLAGDHRLCDDDHWCSLWQQDRFHQGIRNDGVAFWVSVHGLFYLVLLLLIFDYFLPF